MKTHFLWCCYFCAFSGKKESISKVFWIPFPWHCKIAHRLQYSGIGSDRYSFNMAWHRYQNDGRNFLQGWVDRGGQTFVGAGEFMSPCTVYCEYWLLFPFSAMTLLVGRRKGIRPVKSWVLVCWWWQFDWSFVHLTAPVVTNWRPPRPVAQCRQFQEGAKDASVSECTWTLSALEALRNALDKTYLLTYHHLHHP